MNQRTRVFLAGGATVLLFLLVQLGALALVSPFQRQGLQAVEDPSDPTNSLFYIGVLLAFTALMLLVIKLDVRWLLRGFIILTSGFISYYVFAVVFSAQLVAVAAAAAVALALWLYPEWYVIDGAGVIMGAGAAGLFGISFGVLPAIVLLSVLAVYDAISVYGTEHMLTLAQGVMDLRVPVILVIPLTLSYSFLAEEDGSRDEDDGDDDDRDENGDDRDEGDGESDEEAGGEDENAETTDSTPLERDAFFIGLGDAVMPTVMVASAAFFVSAPSLGVPGLAFNLPALTAMVGTMLGLVALLVMVMKGRAHAGLPLLNGGAIGGYLVGALASGFTLVEALGLGPYL